MARGRMISKSLSTSERRAELHGVAGTLAEFCQALYPLLVAHADDWGRLQGDTFTVKFTCDPSSPRKLPAFERALRALHQVGLIHWYQVDDRKYIQINKFDTHQQGLHKRTASEIPEPPGSQRTLPEFPGNSLRTEGKGTELNGTEGKGKGTAATPPPAPTPGDLLATWNETVTRLPKARGLGGSRKRQAQARLREEPALAVWRTVFARMDVSPLCQGKRNGPTHTDWRADFDFALRPATRQRVLEGKYDDRQRTDSPPSWRDECEAMPRHKPTCASPPTHALRLEVEKTCDHTPSCRSLGEHRKRTKGAA